VRNQVEGIYDGMREATGMLQRLDLPTLNRYGTRLYLRQCHVELRGKAQRPVDAVNPYPLQSNASGARLCRFFPAHFFSAEMNRQT
jgi:hypothetical protein